MYMYQSNSAYVNAKKKPSIQFKDKETTSMTGKDNKLIDLYMY